MNENDKSPAPQPAAKTPPETVAEAPAEKPKKKRGPIGRIIRIPMVIVLLALFVIAFGGAYFFVGPLVKGLIETHGSRALGAKISMDSLTLNPFAGSVEIVKLQVADPENTQENMFQADRLRAQIDYLPLLSARLVVREVVVESPAAHLRRAEDGRLNVVAATEAEERRKEKESTTSSQWEKLQAKARAKAANRDWVEEIKGLLQKLQERRQAKAAAAAKPKKVEKKPSRFRQGEVYEFPAPPRKSRLVVEKIEISNMTVSLSDAARNKSVPSLHDADLVITNLAVAPGPGAEPAHATLAAQVGDQKDARIDADLVVDLRNANPQGRGGLKLDVRNFPLAAYAPLYAESWPVEFRKGNADLKAQFAMVGETLDGGLNAGVDQLSIKGKPGKNKVLGLPPEELDKVLQSAGRLDIRDITVAGPYYAPKSNIVEAIAAAFKEKGAAIAEAYLRGRATEEIDKQKQKLQEKLSEKLGEKLGKETGDKLGEKASGILSGILGGKKDDTKKNEQKPDEKKKDEKKKDEKSPLDKLKLPF